uniref:Peptidase C51 domain-containing protein n=1 Tax=Magallana gigas TaxID=29159 RepID=K1QKU9_MAGGI
MRLWALLKLCIGCFLFGLTEIFRKKIIRCLTGRNDYTRTYHTVKNKEDSKKQNWIDGLEQIKQMEMESMIGHNPIGANEWANPQSGFVLATGCYRNVPFENRIKGDIIAFRSNYGSGHMGIVSTNGTYISALRQMIEENSVQDFLETQSTIDRTTVWRYTCGQGEFGLEETSDESTRTESPVANRQFRVMPGFYFRIRF